LKPEELIYVSAAVLDYNSNNESIKSNTFGGSLSEYIDNNKNTDNSDVQTDEDTIAAEFTGPSITLPTFITEQIEMAVDEFDRAVNDKNITALMDGDVIEDVGLGMHYAAYAKSSDIVTFTSNIRRVVARQDNKYLLEVERTVEDSPKDIGIVGQYRDTYFVVVRQEGSSFKYNDEAFVRRVLTSRPVADAENTTVRRLIALNMAGEVDVNKAKDIKDTLLQSIASGISGAETVSSFDDLTAFFNKDTNLLTEDRKSYIHSQLISQISAYGDGIHCDYTITPTEWISGSEQQVEFTTKEFFKYTNKNGKVLGGMVAEKYYLVSHYGDSWLIDDIITINSSLVDVDNIDAYENQVKSATEVFDKVDSAETAQ
jgi:hypothetical protein